MAEHSVESELEEILGGAEPEEATGGDQQKLIVQLLQKYGPAVLSQLIPGAGLGFAGLKLAKLAGATPFARVQDPVLKSLFSAQNIAAMNARARALPGFNAGADSNIGNLATAGTRFDTSRIGRNQMREFFGSFGGRGSGMADLFSRMGFGGGSGFGGGGRAF